jgi:two-component system phosphate regulon sensor histidine kinase PhoR
VLVAATVPVALPVGDELVLYRPAEPGAGAGAVVAPLAFADRIRDAEGALVVPWSGTLRAGPVEDENAFEVVPGLLAVHAVTPRVDRSGLVGLALVLLACAAVFVGGLVAMRRALRRETDALRARAEFLTSVTHELKTPLSSIRLLAERLREGRVRGVEKQHEYYALLAGETARLTVLIENVLDLGRMERGERSYETRPESIDDVAREAAALFEPIAKSDGLEFAFTADAAGTRAAIDRGAIVQAVVNLLDNARKYGRSGGRIELSTRSLGSAGEITVRDSGPGVPLAERERIFQRFARGAAHQSGAVPGVGLGLHLARTIARAHGGELVCTSAGDGPGARFVLRLPSLVTESSRDISPTPEGTR